MEAHSHKHASFHQVPVISIRLVSHSLHSLLFTSTQFHAFVNPTLDGHKESVTDTQFDRKALELLVFFVTLLACELIDIRLLVFEDNGALVYGKCILNLCKDNVGISTVAGTYLHTIGDFDTCPDFKDFRSVLLCSLWCDVL